ncbi:hypothetical protein MPTK1_2g19380 [Marchantia polymorpha subsp. ruderalis]|uniref:Uncharacterized protein n=1 Tax=Marchantia polymorpha TaxID=3197 RepID=A0A2R6WVI4_MARPO|nr:hypothetical protein MARPO_0055s0114 [Marchantia polymorpha]PTQ37865.1 hypothetical protein MARPO_0055s0114 [Marchantia polymorpha]BBN02927.1 hypothetical protein Mp_2g19380 [Marchantia polymorpha subsp. ruderalis]BBN02928.1 hypothetical protein Mp_2g19380 [Marchantia polymorpha subsp. ruderalis]|eukprot:PTQ37864.1 hypothetical protein MARPO_0055s0114 [Marchantia polymorpha]
MVTFSGGFLCGNCAIAAKSTSSLLKTHQNILKFVGAEAEELSSTFWLSSGRSVSLSNSTSYGGRAVNVTWGDKRQVQIPISCREDGGVSGETPSKCSSMPQGPKGSRSVKNLGGLQTATRFACKDAKLMGAAARNLDVRARNDLTILKEGILRLDMRARQDVALIGSGFLKLDARAREDTEKLDTQARQNVKRLRLIILGLQEVARLEAEEHWSNGALDADLRLADLRARRRAMEDAYISIQAVKNVHDTLVRIVRMREDQSVPTFTRTELKAFKDKGELKAEFKTGSVALDRLLELEEAYLNVATLLAETEGMDYKDPDELGFIVATLLDMDEVDGRSGASLLAECATSPDVETRRALADALADAPSLWTLGNAGMGALQKLAKDSNPVVAAAATRALQELNDQLNVEDSFFLPEGFGLSENTVTEDDGEDS